MSNSTPPSPSPASLSWKIGRVRITRVLESEVPLPPEGLLPSATPDALAVHEEWLAPFFLTDEGQFMLAVQGLVIESEGRTILVDTCMGDRPLPMPMPTSTIFLENLTSSGFDRTRIDTVLCTHLHFDHVGWNTMREPGSDAWVPTFPNAEYLFAEAEYEHWKAETEAGRGQEFAGTFDDAVKPVVDAGLSKLVASDYRVTSEVRLEPTPGHTPGHVAVLIESEGQRAMITGDLTHHPVQWAEVDWPMPADSDSPMAAETRRRLLSEHADSDLLVIGTHYAAPTAGRLVRHGSGHRFIGDPEAAE